LKVAQGEGGARKANKIHEFSLREKSPRPVKKAIVCLREREADEGFRGSKSKAGGLMGDRDRETGGIFRI